ncbi:MAG: cupin domain-containing protein [Variovorax sp.]|nr:cupin domain-containing protein [Variovorax sp.]
MKVASLMTAALVAGTSLASTSVLAQDAHEGREQVAPVQMQKLPDVPGKQAVVAVVSYAPGQSSAAHRHPGSVFAYVLEGEVVSQLDGQPPVTYKAGDSWYEPPRVAHLVSRNASLDRPAKLLAFLILDEGAKTKEPLSGK